MGLFRFRRKVKDEPNPWLKLPHDHDWLEANNGAELVCGMCGRRLPNIGEKKWEDEKKSKNKLSKIFNWKK